MLSTTRDPGFEVLPQGWAGATSGSRGFTLLELMIVVVIIAIISFVAFPSMQETLTEGRLYGSAREIVNVMAYARMQAIMRNQAHEVRLVTSRSGAGGAVEVRRYQDTGCSNVLPKVVKEAEIYKLVGLTDVLDSTGNSANVPTICFRPNGRAYAGTVPLSGAIYLKLNRFEGGSGGNGRPVGWPLYVKLTHMGIPKIAKTIQPDLAQGGGGVGGES